MQYTAKYQIFAQKRQLPLLYKVYTQEVKLYVEKSLCEQKILAIVAYNCVSMHVLINLHR